ncbi:MAG: fumarate hydratase, partial [bacterium]
EYITSIISDMVIKSNYIAPPELIREMENSLKNEESPLGKRTINLLLDNYKTAQTDNFPICQDTGLAVIMVDIGQQVIIEGDLEKAINAGVRQGYQDGFLRKSVLDHPLRRENTGDNTPAIIHYHINPGNTLKITVMPKGGGSENASALKMLKPSDGEDGIIKFVTDQVIEQAANACPPLIIGVGIGSNFEGCAMLAKKAIISRPIGTKSSDIDNARLEHKIIEIINASGIGPAGYGGTITALAVHVDSAPCHLACLPCAVNIQCNAHRILQVTI